MPRTERREDTSDHGNRTPSKSVSNTQPHSGGFPHLWRVQLEALAGDRLARRGLVQAQVKDSSQGGLRGPGLGELFAPPRALEELPVHDHRQDEVFGVALPALREEVVLQSRAQLVQDHHGVLPARGWERRGHGEGWLGQAGRHGRRSQAEVPTRAEGVVAIGAQVEGHIRPVWGLEAVEEHVGEVGLVGRKVCIGGQAPAHGQVGLRGVGKLDEGAQGLLGRVQLGLLLRGAGALEDLPVDLDRHDEEGGVHGSRLRQQRILQARLDLVELHQRVLGQRGPRRPPPLLQAELGVAIAALIQGPLPAGAPATPVGERGALARPRGAAVLGGRAVQTAVFLNICAARTCGAQKE